ncbi:GLPGLI family protein [Subsaxibacter sp. CAU 1640]|uniref:GLPGLI family protein n=1 Tax=Subsaxibacter sp. CAU 1640 TaxID=2933271 RepID=UPI0020060F79|nr:GLPGLI family protein [Subsaxibacter sp. CAU 1640]MCK7590377.1 GLPGLI family protein [Subsaxibacter sp. CAU 1640]
MKSISIKLSIVLILISTSIFAQKDFQGKAYYQSKTTVDMDGWGGRGGQMTEEQRKQIAERMKSMLEKTYILTFNRTESIYKEEEKLEAPGAGGNRWGAMMGSFTAGTQYKNVKNEQLLQEQEFFGKQFLIKDSLPPLEWKMENETKQIGQYTCFKATAMKKVDEMDFSNMRRRNRDTDEKKDGEKSKDTANKEASNNPMDDIEVPKEILVTAWYTPQIPVNQGPGDFWGLPGLILEVNANRTTILCSKIVLNPGEKEEIKVPSKGKEVTKDEYNDIMKKKIEEMREMYGGGRGSRRF